MIGKEGKPVEGKEKRERVLRLATPTSMGGGSMKSNVMRSLTPIALSESTVDARLVRWISGTAVGSISSRYARSV